jgi:energy-coupling factor transporter ATP-binding protein EcfA2
VKRVVHRQLAVEGVSVAAPGSQRLILTNIGFELAAGQAVGVIGPSAAGKSTLARALTGVWPLARGAVRLDGAALERRPAEEFPSITSARSGTPTPRSAAASAQARLSNPEPAKGSSCLCIPPRTAIRYPCWAVDVVTRIGRRSRRPG